jgi:hypothetical protein
MVIRKSVYEENGGFKPSIKLTFIYEFYYVWHSKMLKLW